METNLVQGRIIEEVTRGTTPATTMQNINLRSMAMTRNRTTGTPDILRGDRRRYADQVLQEHGVVSLPTLFQYDNTTLLQEGFMQSDWSSAISISATTIGFTSGTGVIADSGNGLGSLQVGDFIWISGAAQTGNNGWHGPITAAAAGSITVATTLTTEAAGASVSIKTCRLVDGSTSKSYGVEWDAGSSQVRQAKGLRVGAMNLSWKSGSFVEESYELMGNAPAMASATMGTGAPTAAPTGPFLNALGNFAYLKLGGTTSTLIISSFDFKGANAQEGLYGIGSTAGPRDISDGGLSIAVDLSYYFDSTDGRSLQELIEAHTTTSLWWPTVDSLGNKVLFHLPALKPNTGDPEIPGTNQRIMGKASLAAFADDTTYDRMFAMFKVAA